MTLGRDKRSAGYSQCPFNYPRGQLDPYLKLRKNSGQISAGKRHCNNHLDTDDQSPMTNDK